MKKLLLIAAAAVFAIGFAQAPASATPIGVDTTTAVSPGGAPVIYQHNLPAAAPGSPGQSFSDTYTFTAPSTLGSIVIDFFKTGITGAISIFSTGAAADPTQSSGTPASFMVGPFTFNGTEFTFSNFVASAVYSIQVSGLLKTGGSYVFQLTANSAVTPIPPALLMFVTALGGLGFVGFRKRNLAA